MFLHKHNALQRLTLRNLDVTGAVSFAQVLAELEAHHAQLKHFQCRQMAQDSRRLVFTSHGDVDVHDSPDEYQFGGPEWTFLEDFVWVEGPFRYLATAEEWEGVQRKIGELKRDVLVTTRSYVPDYDIGGYYWIDDKII